MFNSIINYLTIKNIISMIVIVSIICFSIIYIQITFIKDMYDNYNEFTISRIEQNFDERTITIRGIITQDTFESFIILDLKKFDNVILDSPGGKAVAALGIAMLIRGYGLDTEVKDGGRCASACPWIFQSGINRVAHKNSVFMYHFVSAYDKKVINNTEILIYNMEKSKIGTELMFMDMERYGLDPTFKDLIKFGHEYMYRPEEINNYNIFTKIVG